MSVRITGLPPLYPHGDKPGWGRPRCSAPLPFYRWPEPANHIVRPRLLPASVRLQEPRKTVVGFLGSRTVVKTFNEKEVHAGIVIFYKRLRAFNGRIGYGGAAGFKIQQKRLGIQEPARKKIKSSRQVFTKSLSLLLKEGFHQVRTFFF